MLRTVTTYYLEMKDVSQFTPSGAPALDVNVTRLDLPDPMLALFLYEAVGGDWYWFERLSWTPEEWSRHVERPEIEMWMATVDGETAGYFELEAQARGNVQILYFGLLPAFIGKGLGSFLLSTAVERAWEMGASRVWVHTCSLDHPAALANYRSRGFAVFKEMTSLVELPEPPHT